MKLQKIKADKEKLKYIRIGIRLNTPSPKVIKHAKDYTRKEKYKGSIIKEDYYAEKNYYYFSYYFYWC
jgi:hypothetical protein